jgi:hypothetical protein
LAYHGCNAKTAQNLLSGSEFLISENSYDWLGSGVYFWENDPIRALQWAQGRWSAIEPASIVGVAVDLGTCLDLTTQQGIKAVKSAHVGLIEMHALTGKSLPENTGSDRDKGYRKLDCAVINHLHTARKRISAGLPYQTVRALFPEGEEAYTGAGFKDRTHVQLCVIDQRQILGVFRLPKWQQTEIGIETDLYSGFVA